jgi:DNA mismatch repair protein MutL
MIAELAAGSELTRSARTQYERMAMTFACKGAIKAGQRLSTVEMEELFERLFATDLPYHDVHGRPTVIRLSSTSWSAASARHG